MHLTWSEELLQAIQEVFAREQENAELQPRPYSSDLGDYNSLVKKLEKVIQEQVSSSLKPGLQSPPCSKREGVCPLGKSGLSCFSKLGNVLATG